MPDRRMTIFLLTLFCCIAAWSLPCHAQEDALASLYAAADPAAFDLPEDVQSQLAGEGVSPDEPESLLTLSPGDLTARLWETVRQEAAAPAALCGALLTLTLLSALLGSTTDAAASGGMRHIADTLCVLVCAGISSLVVSFREITFLVKQS